MRFALVIASGLIVAAAASAQEPPKDARPDLSSPRKTYESYLRAILAKDLKTAVACCHMTGEKAAEVLDVVVGMWFVAHDLHETSRQKFGARGVAVLEEWNGIFRSDCSKEAIERTLNHVQTGEEKIDGDTAPLTVKWADDEPLEKPVFHYNGEPRRNRCGVRPARRPRASDCEAVDAGSGAAP
jgi:hypothetical protein